MDVKRLREVHSRLTSLIQTPNDAVKNQLAELIAAIEELENRPQTHLPKGLIDIPKEWQIWKESLGYAENPFVREDSMIVCRIVDNDHYFAKMGDGQWVMDSKGRKRFWKHPITAMIYLNRDYPISGE